jgi:hypothetical protein
MNRALILTLLSLGFYLLGSPLHAQSPAAPVISGGANVILGKEVKFKAPDYPAPAGAVVSYIWQFSTDDSNWTLVPGASWSSETDFKITATKASRGYYRYKVKISLDPLVETPSTSLKLQVFSPLRISSTLVNPASGIALRKDANTSHTLSCTLAEETLAPVNYVWQKKVGSVFLPIPPEEVAPGTNLSGTISGESPADRTLSLTLIQVRLNSDYTQPAYRLLLSNPISNAKSELTLKLKSYPQIPPATDIAPDKLFPQRPLVIATDKSSKLSLSTTIGERPFYYRWLKRGIQPNASFEVIPNSNVASLLIKATNHSGSGSPQGSLGGIGEGPGTYRVEVVNAFSLTPSQQNPTPVFDPQNPFANTNPTLSGQVEVQVISPPKLAVQPTTGVTTLDYSTTTLPEALLANRKQINLQVGNPAAGSSKGNLTYAWQRDGVTVVALASTYLESSAGSNLIVVPGAAGLIANLSIAEVTPADATPIGAIAPGTLIKSIVGNRITLSQPLLATLPKSTTLVLRNPSTRLPIGLANILDPISQPGNLIFNPSNQLEAWDLRGTYRCLISNEVGVVTSLSSRIAILTAPAIKTPATTLSDVFGSRGGAITLSAEVSGTTPITYKWTSSITGDKILGTAPKLTLSKLQDSNEGIYTLEIRNPSTVVQTRQYRLQVDDGPVIPATGNITLLPYLINGKVDSFIPVTDEVPGSTLRLQIQYSGTHRIADDANNNKKANPLKVTWYRETSPLVNGKRTLRTEDVTPANFALDPPINGVHTSTITLNPVTQQHSGKYYCVVANASGSVKSKVLTITAVGKPEITTEPGFTGNAGALATSLTAVAESSISSTAVLAVSSTPITYQWGKFVSYQENGQQRREWQPIKGQIGSRLQIKNIEHGNGTVSYSCRLTSSRSISSSFTETRELQVTTIPIPVPTASPGPLAAIFPAVAKTSERVEVNGSNFRYVTRVYQDINNNATYDASDANLPFRILSDNQLVFDVPASVEQDKAKPLYLVSSGRAFPLASGGGQVLAGDFKRTSADWNTFEHPRLLDLTNARVLVSGDNSTMYKTLRPTVISYNNLLGRPTYLLRFKSRRSLVCNFTGLSNTEPGKPEIVGATDGSLVAYKKVASRISDYTITGPDGVTLFEPFSPIEAVLDDGLGDSTLTIPDTGSSNEILLFVEYNWVSPLSIGWIPGETTLSGKFELNLISRTR